MTVAELFREQLEREVPATRKLLERVPEGLDGWKPHPKSMELAYLAALVAVIPSWIAMMIDRESLDLAGGSRPAPANQRELLELFDRSVADALRTLASATDDHLSRSWRLLVQGKIVDEKPRHAMIAETIAHFAHHRGQLTVYLRLRDIPIPSIYGPTADEGWISV